MAAPNRRGNFNGEKVGEWTWSDVTGTWLNLGGIANLGSNISITNPYSEAFEQLSYNLERSNIAVNVATSLREQMGDLSGVGRGIQNLQAIYGGGTTNAISIISKPYDIKVNILIRRSLFRGDVHINGSLNNNTTKIYNVKELSSTLTYDIRESGKKTKESYKVYSRQVSNIGGYPTTKWVVYVDKYINGVFNSKKTYDKDGDLVILEFDTSIWDTPPVTKASPVIRDVNDTLETILEPTTSEPTTSEPIIRRASGATVKLSRPSISVSPSSTSYNLNDSGVNISWNTTNATSVNFTLGKVKRTLGTRGSLTLRPSDFPNGAGQYTAYLQPVGDGGSGDVGKVVLNVLQKTTLPGPDITHITYPQNIIGKDFQGYDVDFRIDWASVNTDWVDVYVGKKSNSNGLASKKSPQGSLTLNISDVLKKAGDRLSEDTDVVQFKLILIPYNDQGDQTVNGKEEEILINFDKGNLKLRRGDVVRDIRESIKKQFNTDILKNQSSKYLTHILHIGDADNKLISTWGIDKETFSEYRVVDELTGREEKVKEVKTLVLKLYEPLPKDIQPNQQVWISKIESIPIIEQITVIDEGGDDCIVLQPNLNDKFVDNVGLQIYDDLISSGSATSTNIINEIVSSSGFNLDKLDIQFVSESVSLVGSEETGYVYQKSGETYAWNNFVKYSSASERVQNFWYKLELIEFYDNKLELITSGSDFTSSISLLNEKNRIERKKNEVTLGFDAFEKWLYTSSSVDGLTYPGAGQTTLSSSTDSDSTAWYEGIYSSAQNYDKYNTSRLVNNLPSHVQNEETGQEFVLFFDMIGQHFDILWLYTKEFSKSKKIEHKQKFGIKDEFIYQMLESLGWDADLGVQSQALWEYSFGKSSDSSVERLTSGKDRQNQVWRRILNNLPYLLKHKGTKRALHALMSCYGVPASLLTVMEFGGPKDVTQSGTSNFTYEDRTASINISGSASITIPWKTHTSDYPNSVEIRLNTQERQDQQIISGSNWSLDVLKDTGSLATFQLTVGSVSSSTQPIPFFNDEYTQIVVNRVTGSSGDEFTLYAKEAFQERIRNEVSTTLSATTKEWTSGSEIKIGGSTFNGSVDEFRLWRIPLDEVNIDNHTLLPDAIDGTSPSASTEDLILRHDFEYPKNRNTDTEIKNVSITRTYSTGSIASGFDSVAMYPYQYTSYDRTVTAKVPSSGFNLNNKLRFESQYELGETNVLSATSSIDLSYRSRSTKKSFDKSPIDSEKLGLFFSPIKEINMDILKSVGPLNIDDYIGDPSDNYNDTYSSLETFRNYYFERFNLNFNEYVQLVRYIERGLFDQLESLVPARAKVAKGLLFEPHILERSKTKWTKPTGDENYHETVINTTEDTIVTSDNPQYLALVSASEDTKLNVDTPFYDGHISESDDTRVSTEILNYDGTYSSFDDTSLSGVITRNSGSTMGGFEIFIDAKLTGSANAFYDSTTFQQVGGFGPEDLAVAGFGLYGSGSHAIRTRFDLYGNIVKDRIKVFKVKESYTEYERQQVSGWPKTTGSNDQVAYDVVGVEKYRTKVTILPFLDSNGSESTDITSGSNIVEVTPLNGTFSTHYRIVEDLTSGLENSFFNGSKQTSGTTLDGGSPVQTFTTNPNTLRVNDSGRGSGEPILEVD